MSVIHAEDTPELNDARNKAWLEDCALRLVAVLALDRFGDYVADQVCVGCC